MNEERSFQLLEAGREPDLHRTPNYLRLLQAYRSYIEHGASAAECALRLQEITHPALRRYHVPESRHEPCPGHSERLNELLREMVQCLNNGDRAALTQNFQLATRCFLELAR